MNALNPSYWVGQVDETIEIIENLNFNWIIYYVHGVHDFVSFGDQSANAEKVITPHTRHQSLILVCISYQQMGNTFAW